MQNLINSLEGVKRTGKGKYVALCPCHQERTPSFNFSEDPRGGVLAYCFGCGSNGLDAYKALGLDLDELFGKPLSQGEYIPQGAIDDYKTDKMVLAICETTPPETLEDKRRYRLAIARIKGLEDKFPAISNSY